MSIIAVMNRKGGSGKSTLAVHIAAWYASKGDGVMLGNTDKQRSTQAWLGRRAHQAASIATWPSDLGVALRGAPGHGRVVMDTPGGIHGLELAKHLVRVDAIIVPVGPSIFDFETSSDFFDELLQHPRVASGRCQVAVIGMRWPRDIAQAWRCTTVPKTLPLLTVIPDESVYRSCLDSGSSIFDAEEGDLSRDLSYWQPLLDWIDRLPLVVDPAALRLATVDRSHLSGLSTTQASRLSVANKLKHASLSSPESFIETRPPEGVNLTDLQVAGVPAAWPETSSGAGASDRDTSTKRAQPRIVSRARAPLSHTVLSPQSADGWFKRIFKTR